LAIFSILVVLRYNKRIVYFLSDIETTIYFLSQPMDLFDSYASVPLSANSTVYSLTFKNKYPGNHCVVIEVPFERTIDETMEKTKLGMQCKVFDRSQHILYEQMEEEGSPRWGWGSHGFSYCHHKVPQDLPRFVPLRLEVSLIGDIAKFLEEHEGAKLVIRKFSDQ